MYNSFAERNAMSSSRSINNALGDVPAPSEEKLTPKEKLRAICVEKTTDAIGIGLGTEVWVNIYWLLNSYQKLGKWTGYALHGLSEGVASNIAAALISIFKSRWDEGKFTTAAFIDAMQYILIYLPLDSTYQVMEDAVIYGNTGEFDQYSDPSYSSKEVLGAVLGFGLIYTVVHYLMTALVKRGEENLLESSLVGSQYLVFYFSDILSVDLEDHPGVGVRNSFLSSLIVAGYALLTNITINPEVWAELRNIYRSSSAVSEVENDEIQPIANRVARETKAPSRHRTGCWDRFCCFFKRAATPHVAIDLSVDEPSSYQRLASSP